MGYWLAGQGDDIAQDWIKRFDPRFWTVDFPRPMMASIIATAPDALRVEAVHYQTSDLAGLIWEAADRHDHPLLAYETAKDFRGCRLRFRWRSSGLLALDAINGPTLTIEGRDGNGQAESWYVRLWNYAEGSPDDAWITLDFDNLKSGFLSSQGQAVPVADIDRLFISLPSAGYDPLTTMPLPQAAQTWVEITGISCGGRGSTLSIGDAAVPAHGLRVANGYDDCYNVTPSRLLRNMVQLGYRGIVNHYLGMSHYFSLCWNDGEQRFMVDGASATANGPCAAWHRDFLAKAKLHRFDVVLSLSYELLDQFAPEDWKQRRHDGTPALTGWEPPSTLVSPANAQAMGYVQAMACFFAGLAAEAGLPVKFQIGEPWWWVGDDGAPCLYDAAMQAVSDELPQIISVRGPLDAAQITFLDHAGEILCRSTLALRDAVKNAFPEAEVLLLFYAPQVLDPIAPELVRANMPPGWARPAFDILQLEDYDFVTRGDEGASARAAREVTTRLGYPPGEQHYVAGFIAQGQDPALWRLVDAAAQTGRARGVADTFIWAYPQVIRDGFIHFDTGHEAMQPFHDVLFPLPLGLHASGGPQFSTAIVTTASGHEQRNAAWADARLNYDAGLGVRSEDDLRLLLHFFRARRGSAIGFRLRDPLDESSSSDGGTVTPMDQCIGTGDGIATQFALVKHYGGGDDAQMRRITRPRPGTVRVAVDGSERNEGWSLAESGRVIFDVAPAEGTMVTAGYLFDVPVRFASDQLDISLAGFRQGEVPSVPLVEIRED